MKHSASKLTLLSALVVCCTAVAPMSHAADADKAAQKAERDAKKEAAALKKFDVNGNGALDPDEQAARKAAEDKARSDRAEKRKARAAQKKAAE